MRTQDILYYLVGYGNVRLGAWTRIIWKVWCGKGKRQLYLVIFYGDCYNQKKRDKTGEERC